ncbi:MAG: FecR domain-containing protein [Acidobacteria bacterium]|nr:FecR domain-containing protein [Acidobacteriota bacterium]
MNVNARHNSIKLWPHLTLVFIVCAVFGGVAAALWMRHEPKAEAFSAPRAARVERVDGEVGLSRDLGANANDESNWVELTPNTPLTTGDRLYARDDSRASLAFTGRNFATIAPDSALDVVSLSDRRTQLALREGSAIFDVGQLAPDELFEVATPYGAVDFQQPGLYQVGYNDDGSASVSVLSGLAQVAGLAGSGQISKGEMLTLLGQTAAQVALSRLSPDYAGGLLNNYYDYRYPDSYDGRYADYNAYLNDPDYYDPYNRYASYRYVPATVPGAYDLDAYGDWQNLNGYGYAWSPRVEQGWAPYRDGYWMMDDPYGLTWVSNEPWGYAPYHYGRWVNAADRWYWVPDAANTQPAYAPALVAFLPVTGANQVGWVPLAPGDPYAPAVYDANWQPHYVGGDYRAPERVVNMSVPGALTVVSVEDFGRPVERGRLARYDPRAFEGARPLIDPLSNAMLRQASLAHAAERRGFALPPGLAKKLDSTQVYASAPPPKFREDLARRFRVEPVPDKQKHEKLKFEDRRQESAQAPPPVRGFEEVRGRPRGNKGEEKAQERAARARDFGSRPSSPESPQAARVAARAEEHARGDREAQAAHEQQRAAAQQQRFEARRQSEANAQAQRQAAQQQHAQQMEMMRARQAQQQQRHMERPQPQPRPAMQAPPGQERHQQQAPAAGPPSGGGGGRGQGHGEGHGGGPGGGGGHGGGKGKGKP